MSWLTAWIEGRKEIALRKLEMEQERRDKNRKDMLAKQNYERKKDKYALIEQYTESWSETDGRTGRKSDFKIFYTLLENEFGDRKVEIDSDRQVKIEDQCYLDSDRYITIIKPWLAGAYMKEIRTYDSARKDELAHRLKNE